MDSLFLKYDVSKMSPGDLVVHSQGGLFPHRHKVILPFGVIENPPKGGIILETSKEYSIIYPHQHTVKISYDQLIQIKMGQKVNIPDTDKGRHNFIFVIQK